MPVYEYKCSQCKIVIESTNPSVKETWLCDETRGCYGEFKRVYSAPGISFKGKGFYRNEK